jgi:hypothetical protein
MSVRTSPALAVLQQADAALDGWSCDCSAECCRFLAREPYVTEAEWALVAAELARQGRRMPAPRDDERCPLLSADDRCTVYAVRPLGCRTFFCERGDGPGRYPRNALRPLARDLEDLSSGKRGRPLRTWIRAGATSSTS